MKGKTVTIIGAAKKKGEVIPELSKLLEDNFLQYHGTDDVPSQIHSYLSSNFKDLRGLDKNDPRLTAKAKTVGMCQTRIKPKIWRRNAKRHC